MKKIVWLVAGITCLSTIEAKAQKGGQIGMGYNMMLPMGDMKTGWSSSHGLEADMLFTLKSWPVMKLGVEGSFSMYAYNEQSQDYMIFNGILGTSDVSFSSYMGNFGLKSLFESPKPRPIKPYAALQTGVLGMASDLTLDDFYSYNCDYCQPTNSKVLVDDADWYWGAGGGIKFDLGFKKNSGRNFIDLTCNYIGGGTLKYANMNRLYTTGVAPHTGEDVVKIVFLNTITNETQEQQVADIYHQKINMLQIQVKYTFAW